MKRVLVIDGVRTPIGKHGGVLRSVTAQELQAVAFRALLDRVDLDPKLIDEVIVGCVGQYSDAVNVGRVAALMAGLPVRTTACTIQRNCVSGMMSLSMAYQAIQSGDGDLFLCGGTESMSSAPYVVRGARWGLKLRHSTFVDSVWERLTDPISGEVMGQTAENVARMYAISREEQDRFAVHSHCKAVQAREEGRFRDEIVPVSVETRAAGRRVVQEVAEDECVDLSPSMEGAAAYPTVFQREGGTVTPYNACPLSDGAAALLVASEERARALGLAPRALLRAYAYAALPPQIMGLGPAYAVPKALQRAGLALADIDLVELNEAFAAQCLAVGTELADQGWDWGKVNVYGGAIALGHPVGCTGARLIVTLLNALEERQAALGLATACVGGGMGGALIIERM
ncbi:MAG TPA: thiolase family protein [Anaerolineae bacterium]|nr:thiolase family protein [Anaerolineae bacterium]